MEIVKSEQNMHSGVMKKSKTKRLNLYENSWYRDITQDRLFTTIIIQLVTVILSIVLHRGMLASFGDASVTISNRLIIATFMLIVFVFSWFVLCRGIEKNWCSSNVRLALGEKKVRKVHAANTRWLIGSLLIKFAIVLILYKCEIPFGNMLILEYSSTIVYIAIQMLYIVHWNATGKRRVIFSYTFRDDYQTAKEGCSADDVDSHHGLLIISDSKECELDLHTWNITVVDKDILLLSMKITGYSRVLLPCDYKGLKIVTINGTEIIYKCVDGEWQSNNKTTKKKVQKTPQVKRS